MPAFLDSNVLIYTASSEPAKAMIARELIFAGGIISVQVLNETANVAVRKMRLAWEEIDDLLLHARTLLQVEPVTIETHLLGVSLTKQHKIAIYDGMIAAAALLAGCDRLLTEDLHHGLIIDERLTIINPFLDIAS